MSWVDLFGSDPEFRPPVDPDLRASAEWLVLVGYPFDFNFTPRAPDALWEAIVDVVHDDATGSLHGNELTREQVAEWLVDP